MRVVTHEAPDYSYLGEAIAEAASVRVVFAILTAISGGGLVIFEIWP